MENQYIKQYPELFAGKKILYVHGFASSGQSGTVTRLRQVLPEAKVLAPDLPLHPADALALLQGICKEEQPDLIVGTSMGGMYAEQLRGFDRILINPAFQIADTMQSHGLTGKQQFFSPREDGVQEFYVDKPLVKEYRQTTEQNFVGIDAEEQRRVFGLFGDEDPLVHTQELFEQHYPQSVSFHGEHRMNDRSFMHSVLPVVRWIDDRQEHRERPIIYIGVETLSDSYGQPLSSSQKAVRMLIEHYQVYFVSAASSVRPATMAETAGWLAQYMGVPAWGHTVFTNQRHLLYGDYLIEIEETDGAMATRIDFGSDTFKTWEDVIAFFERLGGQ
ncbi:MAG: alpha/beta fold hydrolase [Prevotella sp.]|nr:alpha/beta fold hydrolase [Prevotella sp.]